MNFFIDDRTIYIPVEGRLSTPAGAPLVGARVGIEHEFLGDLGEAVADGSGRFRREGRGVPGRYRFHATTTDGRSARSGWLEVRGDRGPVDVRVDPGNGVTVPAVTGGSAFPDLRLSIGDGLLVGPGLPSGRVLGVDAPALLSDRGIDMERVVAQLRALGVGYVRTQATVTTAGSRAPISNWHVSPHVPEQLAAWREIRDERLAALMRAGVRVQLDLFDDPAAVHTASHLVHRPAAERLKLNAWDGESPSASAVIRLASLYLSRLPRAVAKNLIVGAARDLRLAGFSREWFGDLVRACALVGVRSLLPVPVPPGQTSDLPGGSLLTAGVSREWLDGTRLPAARHRDVIDYLAAVQANAPGSHVVLNTAGVGPGFLEHASELARAVWDRGCSLVIATPETPDAWSEVSVRVVSEVAARLGMAS